MRLREYLIMKEMSITEFARRIGYSYNHVSKAMSGKSPAGSKLTAKVMKFTRGLVGVGEWPKEVIDG